MRALNGPLTELRLLQHFNRKRGMEELRGEGASCQGVIVQSVCVPSLPPCPLRPILRAGGADSHHPSPFPHNLPTRRDIHSMASETVSGHAEWTEGGNWGSGLRAS